MSQRFAWWYALALVCIPLLLSPAAAQDEFEVWNGGDGLWSNDDNWTFGGQPSGAPSLGTERGAQISGGTVIVDDDLDTGGLLLNGGTIDIQSGSLVSDKTDLQTGVTQLNGTLRVSGGTSFTGPDVSVLQNGAVALLAPTSGFEAQGDLTLGGALQLSITSEGTSETKVAGTASIGGVISPVFDGVSPSFGDSFSFLTAQSVALRNPVVELPATVTLERGLSARIESDNSSASLVIGNIPILQVDRVGGATKILNVVGGDIAMTGYTIGSKSGSLDANAFTPSGATGLIAPNPLATSLSEISLENELTIPLGGEINLGDAYVGGAVHPDDEDVRFQFSTPSGRILDGLVEYVGPANDFVANVNPATGEVSLYHLSPHVDPIEITGYTIASGSESLDTSAFNGIGEDGWVSANPQAGRVSELNLESSKVFENGTVILLGSIFKTDGTRDIEVQYSTTAETLISATVEYGEIPISIPLCDPSSSGDVDGNGTVDFDDFVILSTNFGNAATSHSEGDIDCNGTVDFDDFVVLSTNFGNTVGQASSVPEPSGLFLLGLAGFFCGQLRRRHR